MEPEEAEDYVSTSCTNESDYARNDAFVTVNIKEEVDADCLLSSINSIASGRSSFDNDRVLSGVYGRTRWKRPPNGVCEICNIYISASNWSRHLKRKHPNNLQQFLRHNKTEKNNNSSNLLSSYAIFSPSSSATTILNGTSMDAANGTLNSINSVVNNANLLMNFDRDIAYANYIGGSSENGSLENSQMENGYGSVSKNLLLYATNTSYSENASEDMLSRNAIIAKNLENVPEAVRLFSKFLASVGIDDDIFTNPFLASFLASISNSDAPIDLRAQIADELNASFYHLSTELRLVEFPISISVQIFPPYISPVDEFYSDKVTHLAFCAHFWNPSCQSNTCIGIDILPIRKKCSNEYEKLFKKQLELTAITKSIEDRLNELGLRSSLNGKRRILQYVVSEDRRRKPRFFRVIILNGNPFMSALNVTEEIELLDMDFDSIFAFYNNLDRWSAPVSSSVTKTSSNLKNNSNVITCAVSSLSEILQDVCEKDELFISLRNTLLHLSMISSAVTPEEYYKRKFLKHMLPADLYWQTLRVLYENILENFAEINSFFNMRTISDENLAKLREFTEIMNSFWKFSKKLNEEDRPTISLLFPGLKHLLSTLEEGSVHLKPFRTTLAKRIRDVFSDVLRISARNFSPIYLCASMLDTTVAFLLLKDYKDDGIASIRKMASSLLEDDGSRACSTPKTMESPFGFGVITVPQYLVDNKIDVEVMTYLNHLALVNVNDNNGANEFWTANKDHYPLLSRLARIVLAIPVSSVSAERLLSEGLYQHRDTNVEGMRQKALTRFNKSVFFN